MRDGMFVGALRARALSFAAGAAMVMVLAPAASAQLETGFEAPTYNGAADGSVLVTGQDGWYLPPAGGLNESVYTSPHNALGFPANPEGGDQFDGGVSGANVCRAQHDVDFSQADEWDLSYDLAVKYTGTFPATINLASFSMQDSVANRSFISLNNFEDPNTCTTWKAEYNVFDAAGNSLANQSPGDGWKGLAADHWYRLAAHVDFATNRLTHVSITDLDTGVTTEADVDWYLLGGASPVQPLPTAVRCFVGGNAGNTGGYDNVSVKPAGGPPPCPPDLNGDGTLDLFDFLAFTNLFNAQDPGADWNNDGLFDLFDFLGFVNSFNAGC